MGFKWVDASGRGLASKRRDSVQLDTPSKPSAEVTLVLWKDWFLFNVSFSALRSLIETRQAVALDRRTRLIMIYNDCVQSTSGILYHTLPNSLLWQNCPCSSGNTKAMNCGLGPTLVQLSKARWQPTQSVRSSLIGWFGLTLLKCSCRLKNGLKDTSLQIHVKCHAFCKDVSMSLRSTLNCIFSLCRIFTDRWPTCTKIHRSITLMRWKCLKRVLVSQP